MSSTNFPVDVVDKKEKIAEIEIVLYHFLNKNTISIVSSYINNDQIEYLTYLIYCNYNNKKPITIIDLIKPLIKSNFVNVYNQLYILSEFYYLSNENYYCDNEQKEINYYYQPINDIDQNIYLMNLTYGHLIKNKNAHKKVKLHQLTRKNIR
jgi:hypothetical protein